MEKEKEFEKIKKIIKEDIEKENILIKENEIYCNEKVRHKFEYYNLLSYSKVNLENYEYKISLKDTKNSKKIKKAILEIIT